MYHLGRRLKALYATSVESRDEPIQDLTWDYPTVGPHDEPDAEAVLHEINGYTVADGKPVSGYIDLKDDGSTACGCWIYSGVYADGVNQTARRKPGGEQTWVAPGVGLGVAVEPPHPLQPRLGRSRGQAVVASARSTSGGTRSRGSGPARTCPTSSRTATPSYRPASGAKGLDTISGIDPFIMQADGKGWLFAPSGLMDGPLPTHYEPQESAVDEPAVRPAVQPGADRVATGRTTRITAPTTTRGSRSSSRPTG